MKKNLKLLKLLSFTIIFALIIPLAVACNPTPNPDPNPNPNPGPTPGEKKTLVYTGADLEAGYNQASALSVATATGTDETINYDKKSGELPTGLTLNSDGSITGTPTVMDERTEFVVTASASDSNPADATFTITVTTPAVPFTGATLPQGRVGEPYSYYFEVAGVQDVAFALKEGSVLPAGLELDADGVLSGTPTTAGARQTFTVVASAEGYRDAEAEFIVNIARAIEIEEPGEISGFVSKDIPTAYAYGTFRAIGAVAGSMQRASNDAIITYALVNENALPACFELTATGDIRNTAQIPTSAIGEYRFMVRASANQCPDVEAEFTLIVAQAQIVVPAAVVNAGQATVGVAFSYSLSNVASVPWDEEEGEETRFTFAVYDEANVPLPEGLTLSADGVLSGTPARSEKTTAFTVEVSAEGLTSSTFDVSMLIRDQVVTVANGRFEAEYTNLRGVQGAGYSSNNAEEAMIQTSNEGLSMSNSAFVGYMHTELTIPFTFNSSAAVSGARLNIALSSEMGSLTFTNDHIQIIVNGTVLSHGDFAINGAPANDGTNFAAFQVFTINNLSLREGENTILFRIVRRAENNSGIWGPALDYIEVANFGSATLSWMPHLYNMNHLVEGGSWEWPAN